MLAFSKFVALLALVPFVTAAPASENSLEKRQLDTASHCGQWDTVVAGQYTLYVNQWGKANAQSGQSCANLISLSGTTIAWRNNWTWQGGSGVKSYTNINLNAGLGKQLSAIKSIPVNWQWSQSSSGSLVTNVAFDLFTANQPGGADANEIMIWLGNWGAGPISYTYNADGTPKPVASNVNLAGRNWNVFKGSNGVNIVYSFLPSASGQITSFNADVNLFLKYLTAQGLAQSQYLKTVQAGSEATSGTATLTTWLSRIFAEVRTLERCEPQVEPDYWTKSDKCLMGVDILMEQLQPQAERPTGSAVLDRSNDVEDLVRRTVETGDNSVNSYTNINLNEGLNKQLSEVNSIPVDWHWSQSFSGNIISNVAFDLFTSDTPGGADANEIMIWVGNYGAGPISYEYNADGSPKPIVLNVNLAGQTWNVYQGSNRRNVVYSFLLASADTEIKSFEADVNDFLKYLATYGLAQSQYLKTIQAGTEATSGSATMETTSYSVSIN
ncbi:hypothetical protein AAF712_008500 [Marasmius tenuissimus]|uniref:Uncharacterized protein n=1 Tax=Marasmius tenuissimus TaxID=585030 RepID=A0ABR2ZTA6_9AGAR